jgi:hypothetical protein
MINSKPITKKTINAGMIPTKEKENPNQIIVQENDIKIFNKVCPDIMFANKRIDRLKTLEK